MNSYQLYQSAVRLHGNGQLAQAEAQYRQLLATQPAHVDALHMLGVLHYQTERYALAVDLIKQALKLSPQNANFLNNLGLALRASKQYAAAITSYQKALSITPRDTDLQTNLANLYLELDRFEEAATCYRRVLRAQSQNQKISQEIRLALCHALQSLGNQYQASASFAQAEACYLEAVQLQPENASLLYNLGNAQRELGKPAEAANNYRKALKLIPNDADTHNNLGNVLRELGRLDEAILCYRNALRLNPQLFHAKVHEVHLKQQICDWADLDSAISEIRQWLVTQPAAQISPFAFLAMPGTTAMEQRICAENWVTNRYQNLYAQARKLAFSYPHKTSQKLRIGYLASDFRLHPLAFLITDLIKLHDRNQFEIYAYSAGIDDKSAERTLLKQAFDQFVDIRALSLTAAANKINADGIDILLDLTGFTHTSRSGIVALRPAPILVNWLGFPGTMGALKSGEETIPLFDYLLGDATVTPQAQSTCFSEQLALLPQCYQPNNQQRPVGKAVNRADCHLPVAAFVFCCFNQTFKISPQIFAIWMRLLKATPGSVLWLMECNPHAKENLLAEAAKHGITPARLIFAPRVTIADHLSRHTCADLFLDTLPYNAHTTASDALWMGLPLLTCQGKTFAGRVAASLLKAAQLPELISSSLLEYEARALELSQHPVLLTTIKNKLLNNQANLPLFDIRQFTMQLEQVYLQIWRTYSESEAGRTQQRVHL
ncbi:MAG: tetratricopeptide repeat protein [Methylophilaceae bacterium]|nr:tetratricopeptide repeat protein [Methylophilaceae bacterium]